MTKKIKKRRVVLMVCIFVLLFSVTTFAEGKLHALVVSGRIISRNNANSLFTLLQNTKIPEYKVSKDNITKLYYENHNKTKRADVFNSIDQAFKNSGSNDLNIFYYGGHGGPDDEQGHGGIYLGDFDNSETRSTRITFDELLETLSKYKGKFIVIIDSCKARLIVSAAATAKESIKRNISSRFIYVTSSSEWVDEFGTQFTNALVDAVSSKKLFSKADENKDSCVSIAELFVAAKNNHKILAWYNAPSISAEEKSLGDIKLIQLSYIKMNQKTISIRKGENKEVAYSIKNKGRGSSKVKFVTSNSKIATVDSKGKITPKSNGKVTIKAYLVDGNNKICLGTEDSCIVYVSGFSAKASIKINPSSKTLNVGDSFTIKATVTGSSKKVTWSTSNKKVATVKNGKVTGKIAGTVTITAKANGKTAKCKVTVKKKASGTVELTSTVKFKTIADVAKALGLKEVKNYSKYTNYKRYSLNGTASAGVSYIECTTESAQKKGTWHIVVNDKKFSVYGITVGMDRSTANSILLSKGWKNRSLWNYIMQSYTYPGSYVSISLNYDVGASWKIKSIDYSYRFWEM